MYVNNTTGGCEWLAQAIGGYSKRTTPTYHGASPNNDSSRIEDHRRETETTIRQADAILNKSNS